MRISVWSSDVCSSDLGPIARGPADSPIDHEMGRILGNARVKIVLNHPIGGFDDPVFAVQDRAGGGVDLAAGVVARIILPGWRHFGLLVLLVSGAWISSTRPLFNTCALSSKHLISRIRASSPAL